MQLFAWTHAGGIPAPAAFNLTATRTADATAANNTLAADAQLSLQIPQIGKYTLEVFLPYYEATLGTGGFQFDLNSGTATIAGIVYGVHGFNTAAFANAGVTAVTSATAAATIATSASAPSWLLAKGWVNVTAIGTFAVRWAQNTTDGTHPTTLKAGAYFTLATKLA